MATSESLALTETIDNKRYYNISIEGGVAKLPSVTTILSAMTSQASLEEWRNRIGRDAADRITKFSANRGTCMHQKLEYWFLSDIKDTKRRFDDVNRKMAEFVAAEGYTEEELACGNRLFDSLYICGFFERVDSIIEMENTLYSFEQGGYAGRVDCVYRNKEGKSVLLDFKTARHRKKSEWLSNYYLQLSAYFLAYYQMHGIVLDHGELWIAVEDDSPQLVIVTKDELKSWLRDFLRLVKGYHEKYDHLLERNTTEIEYNLPF